MVTIVYLLVQCRGNADDEEALKNENNTSQYIGSKSCVSCHKDVYEQHIQTAHFNTTKPVVNVGDVLGSFENPGNLFDFGNGNQVRVELKNDSVFQTAYIHGEEKKTQRIDMLFGAGRHAQTYASWVGDKLVQLPLTYFVAQQAWSNSPGYPHEIVYNRIITSRCMECHSTFALVTKNEGNLEEFDAKTVMYGIDCEKCHGPAAKHVDFQTKNPNDSSGQYIISAKGFSRQQQIDMCAICHSGTMTELRSAFSFRPGDKLSDFYVYNIVAPDVESLDVHGNQYGILSLSECFIKSEMTCNNCHSAHKNEAGQKNIFSQKCITCHSQSQGNFCSNTKLSSDLLQENCINCHMPEKPSNAIVFTEQKTKLQKGVKMRTHLIKVYPDEAKKIVAFVKNKK